MEERPQRGRRHGLMMLEYRVQTHNHRAEGCE